MRLAPLVLLAAALSGCASPTAAPAPAPTTLPSISAPYRSAVATLPQSPPVDTWAIVADSGSTEIRQIQIMTADLEMQMR